MCLFAAPTQGAGTCLLFHDERHNFHDNKTETNSPSLLYLFLTETYRKKIIKQQASGRRQSNSKHLDQRMFQTLVLHYVR